MNVVGSSIMKAESTEGSDRGRRASKRMDMWGVYVLCTL